MKDTKPRKPRFDKEWTEMIALLPEERREILESAIRRYQLTGTEPEHLEGAEKMAFMLIKKIVNRRGRRREAQRLLRGNTKRDVPSTQAQVQGPAQKKVPARESKRFIDSFGVSRPAQDPDGCWHISSDADMKYAMEQHRIRHGNKFVTFKYRDA